MSRSRAAVAIACGLIALAGCEAPAGPRLVGLALTLGQGDLDAPAAEAAEAGPEAVDAPTGPEPASSRAPLAPRTPGPAGAPAGPGVAGRVLDLADQPIAGAEVRTGDGRQATTDADGAFALTGAFPKDGAFAASRPGFVASAIAHHPSDAPLTLHLQPGSEAAEPDEAPIQPERAFQVRGRVVGGGQPVAGVLVTLGDSRGAAAVPVETDAAGRFELTVFAPSPRLSNATLLAAGQGWVAVATGLDATPGSPFLDFDPADAALSPLVLVPASETVAIQVDERPAGLAASRRLELTAPDGVRLGLEAGDACAWAPLPGLKASVRIEAADADRGLASELVHELAAGEAAVNDALLAPPALLARPALTRGEALKWDEVRHADGYQLTLRGLLTAGLIWEGFTPRAGLALALASDLPAGPYALTLSVWQGQGLAARSVASVGARPLRLLPVTGSYKRASRTWQVTRP